MPVTALIQKPVGVDLALCKRLAQEACRRASAAKSWATLVFGRLNRHRDFSRLARELAELAEKDAAGLFSFGRAHGQHPQFFWAGMKQG